MSKVYSSHLLLMALVFSPAHAPTFQLWRNQPRAIVERPTGTATTGSRGAAGAASFGPGELSAALQREYAEEGEIKRFQLDELYLPKLDVSLPELFDWSDIDRAYLADADIPGESLGLAPDSSHGAAFRIAALNGGFALGSMRGLSGMGASIASSSTANDAAADTSASDATGKGDAAASQPIAGDETLPDDSNTDETQLADNNTNPDPIGNATPLPTAGLPSLTDPITIPTPVQVPAPGAFGLFAFGLAGLHLAGRNKNRSG